MQQGSAELPTHPVSVSGLGVPCSVPTTQPEQPLCIEFCAGSGKFSKALMDVGFKVLAIDHQWNRHESSTPSVCVDLSTEAGYKQAAELLMSPQLVYMHSAPPCGTASRAREKPLPASLTSLGLTAPPQLRSDACPDGLPNLKPTDQTKVAAANAVYSNIMLLHRQCSLLNIASSCENPTRSYLWQTSAYKLSEGCLNLVCDYQGCAHGGFPPKMV